MDSILNTIKKLLGLDAEYEAFDQDIIVGINSALFALNQLGVGPKSGYAIDSSQNTWNDFLGEKEILLESVKQYIYIKTRIVFDPPSSSFALSALQDQVKEIEWRIVVQLENLLKEERSDS